MLISSPCDGFRLAYERHGAGGQSVLLLHGWPGDHTDFRHVIPLLGKDFDLVAPDLRGFGRSDKHRVDNAAEYGASAQARSIVSLIDQLGLRRPVVAGYDIGSRIAQTLARDHPRLVKHLVLSPPLPGVGNRVLDDSAQKQFWYQAFHQLSLADELIDGKPDAVRSYLRHFWAQWSGPTFAITDADLDHLVDVYSPPGAFTASIGWYRAGAGTVATSLAERPPRRDQRISVPASVLWPDHDPLFPREWSDRLDEFFADVRLTAVDGVGHFMPVEGSDEFARVIRLAADR
ncbi:alpha/beta fold hydrolase [Mycobacterium sp. 852002-51057_SCH5723018]|uniref:alpha/beta fold hydrolase n=1 Tax=Mycobacterium sp. 852002-51057_SCH5723018 TaxID=1834094 RepID=UPI0007FFAC89|nr:alpha/beta hydrolase [Mycobacterium sp. 852002-51057_SCH5723018]OBG19298.1 epoxide hydrolase [Mycobacterium sp. 852002-51057_SCH5723018]